MAAASQPATAGPPATDMAKIWSFVKGLHAYNDKWEPRIGETYNDRLRIPRPVCTTTGLVRRTTAGDPPLLAFIIRTSQGIGCG